MNNQVFRDIMPCNQVNADIKDFSAFIFRVRSLQMAWFWRLRHHNLLECLILTKLHVHASQKTWILSNTAVRTLNCSWFVNFVCPREHVSFNSSPSKNYANWHFTHNAWFDTKGNLLRLLITVLCVGWNFLVLDWQFTGDYQLLDFQLAVSCIIIRWAINLEFSLC
jgi:hypothetical protein